MGVSLTKMVKDVCRGNGLYCDQLKLHCLVFSGCRKQPEGRGIYIGSVYRKVVFPSTSPVISAFILPSHLWPGI